MLLFHHVLLLLLIRLLHKVYADISIWSPYFLHKFIYFITHPCGWVHYTILATQCRLWSVIKNRDVISFPEIKLLVASFAFVHDYETDTIPFNSSSLIPFMNYNKAWLKYSYWKKRPVIYFLRKKNSLYYISWSNERKW